MHDPMTVAHEIRRPWPQRASWHDSKPGGRRWQMRFHHDCGTWCNDRTDGHKPGEKFFRWWKPRSYSCFWTIAGRGFYWPPLVTIWHNEPRGHDSGDVCKHYRRWQDETGKWQSKITRGWKWHVHHWSFQIHPLQHLRRWALTRCSWCGGRSTKGDYVNVSHQWDGPRGRWWRGEPGLYHSGCSSAHDVARKCVCPDPLLSGKHPGYAWDECALCGKSRMKDPITSQAYIDAVAIAGDPIKGQRWAWPKEINVHDRREAAAKASS